MSKVRRNSNGRPLINTNAISQAVKPSKAKISLPSLPPAILPSYAEVRDMEAMLENRQSIIRAQQIQLDFLSRRLEEAYSRIRATQR